MIGTKHLKNWLKSKLQKLSSGMILLFEVENAYPIFISTWLSRSTINERDFILKKGKHSVDKGWKANHYSIWRLTTGITMKLKYYEKQLAEGSKHNNLSEGLVLVVCVNGWCVSLDC